MVRLTSCWKFCSFLLTLVSIEVIISESQDAGQVYYVFPSDDRPSSPCDSFQLCRTLNEYICDGTFNNSHVTFIFLPGIHFMNETLAVENVGNLTLRHSDNSDFDAPALIKCVKLNVSFTFHNVHSLSIQNLDFQQCSQRMELTTEDRLIIAALFFLAGHDLELHNITLINGGIHIYNTLGQVTMTRINVTSYLYSIERFKQSFGGSQMQYTFCANQTSLVILECSFQFYNQHETRLPINNIRLDRIHRPQALSLILKCTNVLVQINKTNFYGFRGIADGGSLALILQNNSHAYESPISITNCRFENGHAHQGGGVYISLVQAYGTYYSPSYTNKTDFQITFENTVFTNNSAKQTGAAVCIKQKESFKSRSIQSVRFEKCVFDHNYLFTPGHGGIALHITDYITIKYFYHSNPQFKTAVVECTFRRNFIYEKSCSAGNGVIFITHSSYFNLKNTNITSNNCTAVTSISSNMILERNVNIIGNSGASGGGLMFCATSIMFLTPHTQVKIVNNSVQHAGGGICVESLCLQARPMCFFQFDNETNHNISLLKTISVELADNHVTTYAGHNLFGGSVDNCFMIDSPDHNHPPIKGLDAFYKIFKVDIKSESSVTSIPRKVCFCEMHNKRYYQNCSIQTIHVSKFPGELFKVYAVPVGQLNGTVLGSVHSFADGSLKFIDQSQKIQKISKPICSPLKYRVSSNNSYVTIRLRIQHDGDISGYDRADIYPLIPLNVSLKQCPIGFVLKPPDPHVTNNTYSCQCDDKVLPKPSFKCNIKHQTITKNSDGWLGYVSDPYETNKSDRYLVYRTLCPFDYCKRKAVMKSSIYNFSGDAQCQYNRTGMFCGSCMRGQSIILGTSDCWSCSNKSLSLLLVFGIAGVLLVFFLTICNFTVSEGTISGLIFYANAVQVGDTTFFPTKQSRLIAILRVFIAWINLDFGISACLYNGMDEYAKAWLQFAFPLYVWSLSGLIVYLCHHYISVTRFFGTNSVKVLATLILLSFTKMLRSTITTMDFLLLKFTINNKNVSRYLWFNDPSIPFLQGNSKHIPLFVAGLFFAILSLVFITFLLIVQHLHRMTNFRGFHWIQRLKPFIDSYAGPNTHHARFWTGLLLLCRVFLGITGNVNVLHGPLIYVVFVGVISVSLLFISHCLPLGVYTKHKNNILESIFLLNLTLLSLGTAYLKSNPASSWSQKDIIGMSVGAAFIVFIGILFYHGWNQIKHTPCGVATSVWCLTKLQFFKQSDNEVDDKTERYSFDQDREPLLVNVARQQSYH